MFICLSGTWSCLLQASRSNPHPVDSCTMSSVCKHWCCCCPITCATQWSALPPYGGLTVNSVFKVLHPNSGHSYTWAGSVAPVDSWTALRSQAPRTLLCLVCWDCPFRLCGLGPSLLWLQCRVWKTKRKKKSNESDPTFLEPQLDPTEKEVQVFRQSSCPCR